MKDEIKSEIEISFKALHSTLLYLVHSKCFIWNTLLTLLLLNYFTLFTSLKVLHFSHLQSSKFSKSNNLNRLAGLSLAQLSPSLFPQFVTFLVLKAPLKSCLFIILTMMCCRDVVPFRIEVELNGAEPIANGDNKNRGFSLDYLQQSC